MFGPKPLPLGANRFSGTWQLYGVNGQTIADLSFGALIFGNATDNAPISFPGTGLLSAAGFVPTTTGLPATAGINLPAPNTLGFVTNSALRGQVDGSGNWNLQATTAAPLTFTGDFAGLMTYLLGNLDSGAANDARTLLSAGSSFVTLYVANQNRASAVLPTGPVGPQVALSASNGLPIVLGTGALARVLISQNTTDNLQAVDDGGTFHTVGWRDTPQNAQSGNYQLALTDRGIQVIFVGAGGVTLTVPTNASVPFPIGTVVRVINDSAGNVTVSSGGPTILKWSPFNVAGNRTLALAGTCCLEKVNNDKWYITGGGLS